jgi:tRNA pseudouridine38-40 synthase
VQACVEAALSKVANHPVKVVCAGRTDTGVDAIILIEFIMYFLNN